MRQKLTLEKETKLDKLFCYFFKNSLASDNLIFKKELVDIKKKCESFVKKRRNRSVGKRTVIKSRIS